MKKFQVTYFDAGNCDIESFLVEADDHIQAHIKAQHRYREAGYKWEEIARVVVEIY